MKSLWTKIGFGAVGVFAVGMLLLTLARQAKAATEEALHHVAEHAVAWTSQMAARSNIPFLLDGQDIGQVQQVRVRREQAGALPELHALVRLRDAVPAGLEHCYLEPQGGKQMDVDRGFLCAGSDRGRVTVGEVRFEPAGVVRPVVITREMEPELRRGERFGLQADLGGQVRVEATNEQGKLVHIAAGEGGASIQVNDELGRSLVRLLADSTGAMLRVRDKQGREVVKMSAGPNGFMLSVDTAAAH